MEVPVKGRKHIDVTMKAASVLLDEVVAIGYATVKRKDLTGSVATVSSETLAAVPVASATEALQGKMAGVPNYHHGRFTRRNNVYPCARWWLYHTEQRTTVYC